MEPLRHFGGRTLFARSAAAIEQAHDTLDDREVGIRSRAREHVQIRLARQHPAVQIAAEVATRRLVKTGIDEIGAHLKGLHTQSTPGESRHEGGCDRSLSDATVSAADYEARSAYHRRSPGCLIVTGIPATTRKTLSARRAASWLTRPC